MNSGCANCWRLFWMDCHESPCGSMPPVAGPRRPSLPGTDRGRLRLDVARRHVVSARRRRGVLGISAAGGRSRSLVFIRIRGERRRGEQDGQNGDSGSQRPRKQLSSAVSNAIGALLSWSSFSSTTNARAAESVDSTRGSRGTGDGLPSSPFAPFAPVPTADSSFTRSQHQRFP